MDDERQRDILANIEVAVKRKARTYQDALEAIPKGKYLNLKTGGVYEVIGVGRHSESLKPLVVYISLASGSIFCRPASMWYKKFKKLDEE